MKQLLVEGWRTSSHSYALVNQHQLLQLVRDTRFELFHLDIPFFRPAWANLDGGFSADASAHLRSLPPPPPRRMDVIYRISWPLRVHAGPAERVFVFGTCEFSCLPPDSICGPDGTERTADPRAVEIITPSQWSRDGFMELGFAGERIHVIPHGIDATLFDSPVPVDRHELRARLQIPAEACVFLNIGAVTWNKGIGPLLAAFARHRLRNENAILLLKGADALYGNLVQQSLKEARALCPDVDNPKVTSSTRYLPGNLSQAALLGLYRASDVYIAPYRAEGFNLPVLEALAAGLPVIVTAGGSTDDFCVSRSCLKIEATRCSGASGKYLEPRLESIIECMQAAADGAAAHREAAWQGSLEIKQRYGWRVVTQSLGDLLSS